MDWLIANHASIHCAQGSLSFRDKLGQEIWVQGKNKKPRASMYNIKAERIPARRGAMWQQMPHPASFLTGILPPKSTAKFKFEREIERVVARRIK